MTNVIPITAARRPRLLPRFEVDLFALDSEMARLELESCFARDALRRAVPGTIQHGWREIELAALVADFQELERIRRRLTAPRDHLRLVGEVRNG